VQNGIVGTYQDRSGRVFALMFNRTGSVGSKRVFCGPMDTHAIINLQAIRANAKRLSEFAARPVLAPVKANAYGHGAPRVAQALEADDCVIGFAVATASEVLELRAVGVSKDVVLLTPPSNDDLKALISGNTSFVVSSLEEVAALQAEAHAQSARIRVHLKVNTGLNRLGATPGDAARVLVAASRASHLELYGVMTHLVDSEDLPPAHARHQIALFHDFLAQHKPDVKYRHAANTGGVLNPDLDAHFDLIRPGIGLYGYAPGPDMTGMVNTVKLEPAMTLMTRVIFVRSVRTSEIVGYNATWTATRDSRLATVRLGYADGYHRRLSGRSSMLLHGAAVPVAGRVSMDQTVLDVTDLEADVRVSDDVIAFGPHQITADTVAGWAQTNSYEVLTSIAARVQRVYCSD
jgi:alanine racemase